ncbi:hypothetical protein K0817_008475 [Microbacterium sp. HD4P20]|uniref:hypothetical protein n=1 Tax=Microbacterium sp. HD4P20 TaxID=2864874 RepID=UPI001C6428BC|nr:hypothetical protein [Microbacterium sp. HD4P20]MCP2636600.1 hypothetical protein [Microbacterium sp. HD4P20]
MTFPARSRLGIAALVALSATLALTACSGSPEATAPEQTNVAPTPSAPAPETSGTPEPEPAAADPTCDTLISLSVSKDFESLGWTSRAEPFYIGSIEVADGLRCVWADFEGPAGDHGQMFGWARISAGEAADAQAELVGQGWIREEAPEGTYITESPDTTISADAEGYGMTYLFADGWVTLADTKQNLLLIEWPKG